MIDVLRTFYGLQPTPPADLFQFFIWEIVSDSVLPARRDLAWQALKRLPALTPDAMFRAPAKDLLEILGAAGPHRDQKLELIRVTVGEFKRERETLRSDVLRTRGLLHAARAVAKLQHLSPSTRQRALLFAADLPVLPVDEEMLRVVGRLSGEVPLKRKHTARRWLRERIGHDTNALRDVVVYLRHHAHNTCARFNPHCAVCPLRGGCSYATARG